MAHFARFASIFAQQAGYRKQLMKEAAEKGYPLIRYATCGCGVGRGSLGQQPLLGPQCVLHLAAQHASGVHIFICCFHCRRHMCLHYGYDDAVWELGEQYLVGTQLLVAPVLHEGATSVEVYFPRLSGSWIHIVSARHTFVVFPSPFGRVNGVKCARPTCMMHFCTVLVLLLR
jgi:hypothetical protein